jgi:subtilisin family serine protease
MLPPSAWAADTVAEHAIADAKLAPWLLQRLQDDQRHDMLVILADQAAELGPDQLEPGEQYARLTATARRTQPALLTWLSARGVRATRFWIVNALAISGADLGLARALAARPDVARVEANPRVFGLPQIAIDPPAPGADAGLDGVEWGVTMVRAPSVWSTFSQRGEGVVVATLDTGVEWDHPALKQHYRGWDEASQTVDHRFSWHDAVEDSAAPLDDNSHGTHVTGTMVGDDSQGNQIGVAPAARFVACRNMDHGNGTPALYLECLEWALAPYPPGGDKFLDGRPDLAPQVANNSWGCPPSEGCGALTLQAAFGRQLEAGVIQIAAAGNSGPSCSTISDPPGIYDEVFSVGAVNSTRTLALFSSRGPVTIDGSNRRKPNGAAPGDGVRSSVPGGGYAVFSGTSMASPHVAGVAALILSVRPQLAGAVRPLRCMLEQAATRNVGTFTPQTCGGVRHNQYPNNGAGYGLVDALGVLQLSDSDADGVSSGCDCAPSNGGTYAVPRTTRHVRFVADSKRLTTWDSQANWAGSGTHYDVLRGDVATLLAASGSLAAAQCAARDQAALSFDDPTLPPVGGATFYLLRARNACGDGGWGTRSAGTPRTSTACN